MVPHVSLLLTSSPVKHSASQFSALMVACEDRIGTGPSRARTEVIHEDLGYWTFWGSIHPKSTQRGQPQPKKSRALLQDKFQCPPMSGARRTLRTSRTQPTNDFIRTFWILLSPTS